MLVSVWCNMNFTHCNLLFKQAFNGVPLFKMCMISCHCLYFTYQSNVAKNHLKSLIIKFAILHHGTIGHHDFGSAMADFDPFQPYGRVCIRGLCSRVDSIALGLQITQRESICHWLFWEAVPFQGAYRSSLLTTQHQDQLSTSVYFSIFKQMYSYAR